MQPNPTTPTETSQLEITSIPPSDDWKPGTGMITVHTVETNRITAHPAFQMRASGTDSKVVEKYAGIMKESDPDGWAQFPLILVLAYSDPDEDPLNADGDKYVIVSGFHRFAAILLNAYKEINVQVMYGDTTDALVAALGQNADRSQPRTQADIASMMEFCLTHPEISLWSNNQIAQWCAVSPQTVNNHENRLLSDESSTSKLEIEKRPDQLKFMDRHGNVSMRRRTIVKQDNQIGSGLALDPKGKVIESADVVETEKAVDVAEQERVELLRQISTIFMADIQPLCFHADKQIAAQRESALVEEHPLLEMQDTYHRLGLDDLRGYAENLSKIKEELFDRKDKLRDECRKLYHEGVFAAFPSSQTTQEEDTQWKAALEADFPGFVHYQSIWSTNYWDLLDLKVAIEGIVEHLKTNGIDAYLPASYTERKQAEKKETSKKTDKEKVAHAVDALRDEIKALVIDIVDPEDNLQWSIQKEAVSFIVREFNDKFSDMSENLEPEVPSRSIAIMEDWDDMAKRSLKHIRRVERYWQRIKAGIEADPQPQWVTDGLYQFECKASGFEISARRGWDKIGEPFEISPESPLSEEERIEIVGAAQAAAQKTADDIHRRHSTEPNKS